MAPNPLAGIVPAGIVARRTIAQNRAMHRRTANAPWNVGPPAGALGPITRVRRAVAPHPVTVHPNNTKRPKAPRPHPTPVRVKGGGGGGGGGQIGGGRVGKAPQNSMSALLARAMKSIIDPKAYANAAANAKYGGLISDLSQQIANAPGAEASHQADIDNWYNQVATANKQGTAAQQAALTAALGSSDASTQAIINALGGGANPGSTSVGDFGAIARAGIQGQGQNAIDYSNDLASIIALDRATQHSNESKAGAAALADLQHQLTGAKQNRGAEYAADLANAQGTRFSQLGQLQNLELGQQLAGPQLEAAQLKNQAARQSIRANSENLKMQQQQWALQRRTQEAQLADFKNQMKSSGKPTTIASLNPSDNSQVNALATQGMIDKQGRLTQSPSRVRSLIVSQLRSMGFSPTDPGFKSRVDQLTSQVLTGRIKGYDKKHKTNYRHSKYNPNR